MKIVGAVPVKTKEDPVMTEAFAEVDNKIVAFKKRSGNGG